MAAMPRIGGGGKSSCQESREEGSALARGEPRTAVMAGRVQLKKIPATCARWTWQK